ncbi:MAG: hypothetical protein KGS72_23740 [Cyanobacteria bacterium REEB67]|nr:hypothetical protein [Cyanobacteria bacterium REEB67]
MAKKLQLSNVPVAHIVQARDLFLRGDLSAGLAMIESAAAADNGAALMLAQIRAFQGQWQEVRALCLQLLKQPFSLCQYRDAQDVMKLFVLTVIEEAKEKNETGAAAWTEAKDELAAVRAHLDSLIDMAAENNSYAESFNRFEAFIWSAGKGRVPFKINSPLTFASMGEEQYARLININSTKRQPVPTFADLDESSKHDFYLWKALYDEDLERALTLYDEEGGSFVRSLMQATLIAQLLMTFDQNDRAWSILKAQIARWTPQHTFEIVPIDLLWDEKMRPLMSEARCLELLQSPRAKEWLEQPAVATYERERLTHIASLARCLTEETVADLEQQILDDPDNLELHIMLIGAYSKYVARNIDLKKPHISWLIAKLPDSQIIEDLISYLFLDKETNAQDFEDFKEQWLEVIESHPGNTRILFNASLLLGADDGALAEELLTRAQSIDGDNPKFAERLYEMNAFHVHQTRGQQRILCAREALNQISIMESIAGASEKDPFFSKLRDLRRRAWFSLESGELDTSARLAREMVELARAEKIEDKYLYLQEVLNGRLALRVGEKGLAINHLNNLLTMEPFRHFRPDYPHLTLASEIFNEGEKAAVINFLSVLSAQTLPAEDKALLERFIEAVDSGDKPWCPAVRL